MKRIMLALTVAIVAQAGAQTVINGSRTFRGDVVAEQISAKVDYTHLKAESFAQSTFTPSHTKWEVDWDLAFVGDVPTYVATANDAGYLLQETADLAVPMVANRPYRFSVTLANVTAGNLTCEVWEADDNVQYGSIPLSAGTHVVDFISLNTLNNQPYLYCYHAPGGFQITAISLKEASGGDLTADNSVSGNTVSATLGYQIRGNPVEFNVLANGADPTGVLDSKASIQATLDMAKEANGGKVVLPHGTYLVSGKLLVPQPIELVGVCSPLGGTILKTAPGYTDTTILLLTDPTAYWRGFIHCLGFNSTTGNGVAMVRNDTDKLVIGSTIEHLSGDTDYGVILTGTSDTMQSSLINDIFMHGDATEGVVSFVGNVNRVVRIDVELGVPAATVTTTPYVYAKGGDNLIEGILVESQTKDDKPVLHLDHAYRTTVQNVYDERPAYGGAGPAIIVERSADTHFTGDVFLPHAEFQIQLIYSRNTIIDNFTATYTGNGDAIAAMFDIDSGGTPTYPDVDSTLRIKNLNRSIGQPNIRLAGTLANVSVDEVQTYWFEREVPGDHRMVGHGATNLLMNPSFESGVYGWTWTNTNSPTFIDGPVGGKAIQYDFTAVHAGDNKLYQQLAVSTAMVGQSLTVSFLGNVTTGRVCVYVAGGSFNTPDYPTVNCIPGGAGWSRAMIRFVPKAAGTYNFGAYVVRGDDDNTILQLDEFVLAYGTEATLGNGNFQSLELGGKSQTYAAAAPTTGTWKTGDIVWSTAPALGVIGWTCITAGTPGTWAQILAIPGGSVPAWKLYALASIANGVNGCANANGCWQVNGVLGANRAAALTQDVVLFQLPGKGKVSDWRIKSNIACTGAATANSGLGTTGNNVLFRAQTYDIAAAVSDTNLTEGPTAGAGSGTAAATNIVASVITTSGTQYIDTLAAGCAIDYSVMWAVLP